MPQDGVTPFPGAIAIEGTCVCVLEGLPDDIEQWVQKLKEKTSSEIDYHYSSGRANVFHRGSKDCQKFVLDTVREFNYGQGIELIELNGEKVSTVEKNYRRTLETRCVQEHLE